jgi:hypothetical protein
VLFESLKPILLAEFHEEVWEFTPIGYVDWLDGIGPAVFILWVLVGMKRCTDENRALGSKKNLVTILTGVSHETLQIYHMWASYAMFGLPIRCLPHLERRYGSRSQNLGILLDRNSRASRPKVVDFRINWSFAKKIL